MIKLRNLPEASPAIKIIKLLNAGILRESLKAPIIQKITKPIYSCLLYTSDAADE